MLVHANNGWNETIWNTSVAKHISEENRKELSRSYLPHLSFKFEGKCSKLMKYYVGDRIVPILSKATRSGFCNNVGCKQTWNACNFHIKYTVSYDCKTKKFEYKVYIKGKHGKLLFGDGVKDNSSMLTKILLNDAIEDNKTNKEINLEFK